jgi:hypothetical protein
MVDTNVRVTKTTHARLKYLAQVLGVTISEVIDAMIVEKNPDIDSRIEAREREARELRRKTKGESN